MCLGKVCAGWGSIFLLGFPCYISLAVLEQDDSFFTALLIHLGRDAGFFFLKAQMKTSLYTRPKRIQILLQLP